MLLVVIISNSSSNAIFILTILILLDRLCSYSIVDIAMIFGGEKFRVMQTCVKKQNSLASVV